MYAITSLVGVEEKRYPNFFRSISKSKIKYTQALYSPLNKAAFHRGTG
jgi:hypothetical protein